MYRYIIQSWPTVAEPDLFLHEDGYYMVKFQDRIDLNEVLLAGPYSVNNKPIILKLWTPDFVFHDEFLKEIPLWIKFPQLPISYWSGESLSRIASTIGSLLFADECITKRTRISLARLLVEVNVTTPLPECVKVLDPSGEVFEQQVVYEWKPIFCNKCLQLGHICETKPAPKLVPKQLRKRRKRRRRRRPQQQVWATKPHPDKPKEHPETN
ncbi:uncharacterized protein LOC132063850 [Lycium ferocissimum]|uniref:uncharacterized protein LOC132063850 n=1 Tax=Lycium ferocissimum TaxID=112874 RepID=UPI0028168F8B|nr:uncharacterized protein LOC132063850 [Lycium ferocissimum]